MALFTMILLFIASGLRMLITQDSYDRENRIIITYEKMSLDFKNEDIAGANPALFKKGVNIRQEDSLSWNFIRVMKEREKEAGNPDGSEIFDIASDPDIASNTQNHPMAWSAFYMVFLAILTQRNMYNFF